MPSAKFAASTSWQVPPAQIEAVLRQHRHIAEAAVVGVRREDGLTEVPKAFIVRTFELEAQSLTSHDVYSFARDCLASFKAPDGGVVFVDNIPKSPIGKIQRFKLKDMVGVDSSIAKGELPVKNPASVTKGEHDRNAPALENGQKLANGQVPVPMNGKAV